ncbi:hypothetical protein BDZ91DRAFT_752304 [Kalaharituber pfeilii]|nr:hypothetical protein BDZ91DRAFT_752304 [Kalaharituber pfeilii]
MPKDNRGNSYDYKSSGQNDKGSHYCSRDYGNGSNAYHYSNSDGSYYYSNSDGSKYHDDGKGGSYYSPPPASGNSTSKK